MGASGSRNILVDHNLPVFLKQISSVIWDPILMAELQESKGREKERRKMLNKPCLQLIIFRAPYFN
jgi:hypothetical protein